MSLEKINKRIEDVFTYTKNIKNKMDSIRDRMIKIENRMDWINQNHSEIKKELEKIKFIEKNVGTHLGVEIEPPEPEPEEDPLEQL